MGKEKRPLQSERINRYLFCFWFQVIRQDDLSNRDFPQFLFHPMGEADRLCRTAGFPSVIYSDHSVGVLHHIAVSVGVDAWEIFFLYDNNIRTSLQQFTGSCFLIQAVQTLAVRDHCDQLQRRIGLLSFQHQLCIKQVNPSVTAASISCSKAAFILLISFCGKSLCPVTQQVFPFIGHPSI